ncbi:MAG: hypothetical protein MK077_04965 [Phycisphaerales bacterium]|nr:hypothetical protein [Phycisphaerales bacterium]
MSATQITGSLQSYQMMVYRLPLHPEFFQLAGRKKLTHPNYEFEGWVFRGGHVLRFEHASTTVSEVITSNPTVLPERGLVTSIPCMGEREYDEVFAERVTLMSSMQTETLSEHLYLGTYQEMLEHGEQPDCISTTWQADDEHPSLSILEYQRYGDEIHLQSYHLRGDCGLVLRTQTIMQAGVTKEDED